MINDVPPGLNLTQQRWQQELQALRARHPSIYQHSVDVGAAVFEVTVDVDGTRHHLRMALPPRYPAAPPVVREVEAPGGAVMRPAGTRRFADGSLCLFPHGSDSQGWRRDRLAVEALAKAEEFLAHEDQVRARGGRRQREDLELILPRSMVEVMQQPGAFGTLQVASLGAAAREALAVAIEAHNPEISFPAGIEPQWTGLLSPPVEVPWASIPLKGPTWEDLLHTRAGLDERLQEILPDGVSALLRASEHLVLARAEATSPDVVAIRRPHDDVMTLKLPTVVMGRPSDVLFCRVDGVISHRERLTEIEVVVLGLGSLGGATAVALARAGVGRFLLIDHDRLSLANVTRHVGGLRDLGRPKVEIIRNAILAINPTASVELVSKPLAWDIPEYGAALELERWLDRHPRALVIATFVFAPIEQQLNELLVGLGVPAIYASVLGAAEHGRIFRVIPGRTPCFECVLDAQDDDPDAFPRFIADGFDEREQPAYLEPSLPGLAIDIEHIALITARLTLQTLSRTLGVDVGLADEDGHHLLWTNRGGWAFDRPLQLRVERIPRNPRCPVCSPAAPHPQE